MLSLTQMTVAELTDLTVEELVNLPIYLTLDVPPCYLEMQATRHLILARSDPFKLNPAGSVFRNRKRAPVLHLAKAKPTAITITANMTLLTPCTNLAAGDFLYKSEDDCLIITNSDPVTGCLIPDASHLGEYGLPVSFVPSDDLAVVLFDFPMDAI